MLSTPCFFSRLLLCLCRCFFFDLLFFSADSSSSSSSSFTLAFFLCLCFERCLCLPYSQEKKYIGKKREKKGKICWINVVQSHPLLVVTIAVKDTKSVSFLKFIPTGSTNHFLLSDPFIVSIFLQHVRTKVVTSHLFTLLFMFIHLPLIHFAPPPRLLIDLKNSKWLTYFFILLCICYCFSHLIGLFSIIWLFLLYKFTRFFKFIFCFSLAKSSLVLRLCDKLLNN